MNRQFITSVVVLFVWTLLAGFVVHAVLLSGDYSALPNIMRSEEDSQGYFGYMLFAHVCLAIGITWVYRMGRQDRPWLGQGIRFGIALFLLVTVPMFLIYYSAQQLPGALVTKQIVFDGAGTILAGVIAAYVNK